MVKKQHGLRLASVPPQIPQDQLMVVLPTSWIRAMDEKLDRLLRATGEEGGHKGPKPAPVPDGYLTRKQVVGLTHYSPNTVRRLIRAGKLQGYGPRGDRFRRADIDAMMAQLPANATDEDREIAEARARLHAEDDEK